MTNPKYINRPLDSRLTPQQQARLVLIMEESSEVSQAAAKCLRFGMEGRGEPHDHGIDNYALLMNEWEDLKAAISRLMLVAHHG